MERAPAAIRSLLVLTLGCSLAVAGGCGESTKAGAAAPEAAVDGGDGGTEPPCTPSAPTADVRCEDPCFESRGPSLRLAIDPGTLGLPEAPAGSQPVGVGIFLTTSHHDAETPWTEEGAAAQIRSIVDDTNEILAQCSLHVRLETAQVVALPARLLDIQGNQEGSWGGHPPPGTVNPDRFNYDQNERLTDETRELFTYGKAHTSRNAIAAFTVRHITYYAEQELTEAGGLSFPPNNYHHADDYPLRNSVLLVPSYGACGALPTRPRERTLAHELGHMLLDSGLHEENDPTNLMSRGGVLTPAQCERMRANRSALYGEQAVPDPGPPSQ